MRRKEGALWGGKRRYYEEEWRDYEEERGGIMRRKEEGLWGGKRRDYEEERDGIMRRNRRY